MENKFAWLLAAALLMAGCTGAQLQVEENQAAPEQEPEIIYVPLPFTDYGDENKSGVNQSALVPNSSNSRTDNSPLDSVKEAFEGVIDSIADDTLVDYCVSFQRLSIGDSIALPSGESLKYVNRNNSFINCLDCLHFIDPNGKVLSEMPPGSLESVMYYGPALNFTDAKGNTIVAHVCMFEPNLYHVLGLNVTVLPPQTPLGAKIGSAGSCPAFDDPSQDYDLVGDPHYADDNQPAADLGDGWLLFIERYDMESTPTGYFRIADKTSNITIASFHLPQHSTFSISKPDTGEKFRIEVCDIVHWWGRLKVSRLENGVWVQIPRHVPAYKVFSSNESGCEAELNESGLRENYTFVGPWDAKPLISDWFMRYWDFGLYGRETTNMYIGGPHDIYVIYEVSDQRGNRLGYLGMRDNSTVTLVRNDTGESFKIRMCRGASGLGISMNARWAEVKVEPLGRNSTSN